MKSTKYLELYIITKSSTCIRNRRLFYDFWIYLVLYILIRIYSYLNIAKLDFLVTNTSFDLFYNLVW